MTDQTQSPGVAVDPETVEMPASAPATWAPPIPSLWVALPALMALQMVITCAQFAPAVLAPKLGIASDSVGLFTMTGFLVAIFTALSGGMLVARVGSFRMGALCLLVLACGVLVVISGASTTHLLIAGVLVGIAFGPETPAASAVLARITTPEQRSVVFSVRQTGNQIGAALGSILLPVMALVSPTAGLWAILAMALVMAVVLFALGQRYDHLTRGTPRPFDPAAAFRLVTGNRALSALALASIGFGAMQLALNAFFVTYGVGELGLTHVVSGQLLALAQIGGLVGRLGAGWVASRLLSPLMVLITLGVVMAACSAVVGTFGRALPIGLLAALLFVFGLTASGWNGLFFAEVARLAPADRTAEATGTMLATCFVGVVLSSFIGGQVGVAVGLQAVFEGLAVVALVATVPLVLSWRWSRA